MTGSADMAAGGGHGIRRAPLLMICPAVPSPTGNGLAMRASAFLSAYSARFRIDLAVIPVAGPAVAPAEGVAAKVSRFRIFPLTGVDTHFSLIERIADPSARLQAFRHYPKPAAARFVTGQLCADLREWTGGTHYAAVHVFRLAIAELPFSLVAQAAGRPVMVLDADEDDASVQRGLGGLFRRCGDGPRAAWAEAEADHCAAHARRWLPEFDAVWASSAEECRKLAAYRPPNPPITVANLAAAAPGRRARRTARPRSILFVGNLNYPPNADGILWFATQVLPPLRRRLGYPVELVVVGAGPASLGRRLKALGKVQVTGLVATLSPLYAKCGLAIVPLRAGGGTRIKILEAAAHGVPVVTTTIGAEGLGFRHGRDLLRADTPSGFAAACAALLSGDRLAARLAVNATALVSRNHDRIAWMQRTAERVECLIREGTIDTSGENQQENATDAGEIDQGG